MLEWDLLKKQYVLNWTIPIKKKLAKLLTDVYASLNDKGYNPINQIVGYVLSGDPAYVPRYNNARNQIRKYERDEIVEELVRYYLKGQGVDL